MLMTNFKFFSPLHMQSVKVYDYDFRALFLKIIVILILDFILLLFINIFSGKGVENRPKMIPIKALRMRLKLFIRNKII